MKFQEFVYQRPDIVGMAEQIEAITEQLKNASTAKEAEQLIRQIEKITDDYDTMESICYIRNTINTVDEFYEKEVDFLNENDPVLKKAVTAFQKVVLDCPFRKELEEIFSKQYFTVMELRMKSFSECIMEDLIAESKLCTKYAKLLASAKIEFDGKVNNLSQMTVYTNSIQRETRIAAYQKIAEFMTTIEDEVDSIYDQLVHVRDTMAKKMGYKNYVDFGYIRLGRSDYDSKKVANYRKQVLTSVVPMAKEIIENQAKRLGLSDFSFYDIALFYPDGNPNHEKTKEELVEAAYQFYSQLSNETKEFFSYMCDHELMDLETKPNKAGGGYCTMIPNYKAPFIFSNFNGSMGDVDVLTHEAGHAFQIYTASKVLPSSSIYWPTLEACEIHSMSMEFFAHPYMNLFFKHDADKYRLKHLSEAITFIPYGVCVDEFQHFVYEHPEASCKERKEMWHKLEHKYTPWKNYAGMDYYERGNFWQRQSHIFQNAFYYIDYTLAQVCAFQFYILDQKNHQEAWKQYLSLCKLGGSKSFLNLLQAVGLSNPFEDGCLESIMNQLRPLLEREGE